MTMKLSLLFLAVFMIFAENGVIGKPAPNPAPDNDVHFHVNMPGAGKSFPLRNEGKH